MKTKEIRELNSQQFLDDLKQVTAVMVFAHKSFIFLHVTKKELLQEAKNRKIDYYITDKIFTALRNVMVVI